MADFRNLLDDDASNHDGRRLQLTPARLISIRPVHWLWDRRIALGTLALLAGREGIGKSLVACTLAAEITQGRMDGAFKGTPKAVLVAATEDSWAHTIVPRLMAAGADLDLVFKVDVETVDGVGSGTLSLPTDLHALELAISEKNAAVLLLDPLLSRLHAGLDTHKDAEVRQALEPLVAVFDRTQTTGIGIIHVNKSGNTDPLTLIMASRAFSAVARSVLFAMRSPDDEAVHLLGQPKNNLGRADLPTMLYKIKGVHVADTDEGPVWTGGLEWTGTTDQSIRDALDISGESSETRTAIRDATDWLEDYLKSVGGCAASGAVKDNAKVYGHSIRTLQRARDRLGIKMESSGFPCQTFWRLPAKKPEEF